MKFSIWFWYLKHSNHGHDYRWGLHYDGNLGLRLTSNGREFRNTILFPPLRYAIHKLVRLQNPW